jgi:hypothetical protein
MNTSSLSFGVFIALGVLFSLTCLYACSVLLLFRFRASASASASKSNGRCGCGEAPPWTLRNTVHLLIALSTLCAFGQGRAPGFLAAPPSLPLRWAPLRSHS